MQFKRGCIAPFFNIKSLISFHNKVKAVDKELLIVRSIEENNRLFVQLNQAQLKKGITSKGTKIRPKYKSPRYAEIKNKQNPEPGFGTPDLFRTGEMFSQMDTVVFDKDYEITSFAPVIKELVRFKDAFGLSPDSNKIAIPSTTKIFNEKYRKAIGL